MYLKTSFTLFKITQFFKCNRFRHNYIYAMDKAYFRHLEGTEEFQVTFHFRNPELKIDRKFNFHRRLTETVGSFLGRISTNLEKAFQKKSKGKKKNETTLASVAVQLHVNNEEIDSTTPCETIFKQNGNIVLIVSGKKYQVVKNSPWIDNISLPNSILASYPVYPIKFETSFTNTDLSEFIWYKSQDKINWNKIGSSFIFEPSNDDINYFLKLTCLPRNEHAEGPLVDVISDIVVQASPGYCPFHRRHQFTKERKSGQEFRIVTYNILADLYCDSEFSRAVLYPYCPPYALHIDYRKLLIIKELMGYNADIICLQEVDRKVYTNDLEVVFNKLGYGSNFCLKGGQVVEGLACFFNKERFSMLETSSVIFADILEKNEFFKDIWETISKNEKLKERLLKRTNGIQTTTLLCKESEEILLIANTHLYFHPDADHIRLLQGGLAIKYLELVKANLEKRTKHRISLIFCGDFNSVPECGIYQLYTSGNVSSACPDWRSNEQEAVSELNLSQPFKLDSACGSPPFTNFTAGFGGCLDYIFYDVENLEVTQVVPLPSNEELSQHTALPSVVFPSDHISLVSDLKWRR